MSMEQLNEGKRWMLVGVEVCCPPEFFCPVICWGKRGASASNGEIFFVFLTHMDLLAEFTLFVGAFHQ